MELAREEREEFAELLAGLSPHQWESPSLCERWRVRDVVAHVISYDELDFRSLAARFAKGWFLQDRVNELGVADLADRTPAQLLELMRIHAEPSGLPAGWFAPLIRGAWRARGVKLVATDLDWSHGRGPQVSGSGEALLMAMAGRRDALGDLTGPGRSAFAAHVGA
ncbi:maleylpyruvate isomerase family mycothiol-dependent enzyme [Rhodococcus sp. NCIMB 12038]|uniref:maleylpyruvate isomerase family mycothiol-dependent enzyme n=1 Tax=Rhodococcus sp. NCIMB 12038 TaxID=933800 RepID=UPI000B5603F9|nr:maleylpyruvate isomerase family mycothiol-dependent enzyme [Rhodococcus sp. NCIMB 12038]OUS93088.1 DinB family protein [Rhodococcus sp. NCIMB 12038]